ncbi:MAG: molybdenum cofactor biosynthesis protein B [Candidatus Pacebacteria bacterium]|nr:molybdenum cofactor biosynthesis protein B [Candidatus Paceibacterota bacterium]
MVENSDHGITPRPVGIAILTLSDSRDARSDRSGDLLVELLLAAGHRLAARDWAKDELPAIVAKLNSWLVEPGIEVIITTGGTGVTGRDVTPEAFKQVCEKEIPGFGEIFRLISYGIIGTSTIQSRATAGVAKGKYLFALPGSPSACRDGWNGILRDQLDIRHRPCNFVELMPRLEER